MKKISFWAKNHKRPARIIIVASFILLNGLGILTGILLNDLNIYISGITMLLFVSAFIAGVIFYPSKNKRGTGHNSLPFYFKQKGFDFILAASAFCMVTYSGNRPETLFQQYPVLNASVISVSINPKDSTLKSYRTISEFTASIKNENGESLTWKERKKMLKEQVKEIKKANDLSNGEKTLLIILSVLVALGLIALIATLSCSLSCSGSLGAAVLVGVGGTALIILLLVIAIRAIYGKKKNV